MPKSPKYKYVSFLQYGKKEVSDEVDFFWEIQILEF